MKTRTSIYHRTFAFAYVLLVAVIFCGCEDRSYKVEAKPTNTGGQFKTTNEDFQIKNGC